MNRIRSSATAGLAGFVVAHSPAAGLVSQAAQVAMFIAGLAAISLTLVWAWRLHRRDKAELLAAAARVPRSAVIAQQAASRLVSEAPQAPRR